MTHMRSMGEHEGEFTTTPAPTTRKCPRCGSPMTFRVWESSDGAFEDEKHECSNPKCGYVRWVDGIDS